MPRQGDFTSAVKHCDRRVTEAGAKRRAARRVLAGRLAGFVAHSSQILEDMLVVRASPPSLPATTACAKIYDVVFSA